MLEKGGVMCDCGFGTGTEPIGLICCNSNRNATRDEKKKSLLGAALGVLQGKDQDI